MVRCVIGIFLLGLAGCTSDQSKAYDDFRTTMFDPEAAQFRNFEQVGDKACFEVNGRNRFGGYTGFQTVLAIKTESGDWIGDIVRDTDLETCIRSLSLPERSPS